MQTWDELKAQGADHYKTGGVEPVDLYRDGNMFEDFALCSIIKYAFRSRMEMRVGQETFIRNMDKIIDYAQKLIAGCENDHTNDRADHTGGAYAKTET